MYYESELYHHGIKGQKWGVHHGPPYPLDRKERHKRLVAINKASARRDEKYSFRETITNKPIRETIAKSKEANLSIPVTARAVGRKYVDTVCHPFKSYKVSSLMGMGAISVGMSFAFKMLTHRIY